MSVLQSGSITPGHVAIWTTTGVIQDGGSQVTSGRVLAAYQNVDFDTTDDQAICLPPAVTAFQITGITVTNASISLDTAAGGFYPAAAKTGTAIVASSQIYSSLVNPTDLLVATVSAGGLATRYSADNLDLTEVSGQDCLTIYFSLTTRQGVAARADVYIIGYDLS